MPKLPGRESTKLEFELADLLVTSFHNPWDKWLKAKPCVVKGCDHRVDNCIGGRSSGPARVVVADEYETEVNPRGGFACSCCVAKILN